MIRRFQAAIFFFLFPLLLSGQNRILRDDQDAAFPLAAPPRRIVSLAPNITEILFALGLDEEVVGVTRYCDFPPAALRKEKIGGMLDPNLEMIKFLAPDLVVSFRGNPLRIIERLRNLRFPVFVLDIGNDLDSIASLIIKIGRLTHKEREASALASDVLSRFDAVKEKIRSSTERPRAFLALSGTGLWTCGRESYLNDLLVKAGATNVTGEILKNWLHYGLEQLIRDDPEIIFVLARSPSEFRQAEDRYFHDSRFKDITAVRTQRIYFMDQNVVSRFGPRLAEALEKTARLVHPECFGENP